MFKCQLCEIYSIDGQNWVLLKHRDHAVFTEATVCWCKWMTGAALMSNSALPGSFLCYSSLQRMCTLLFCGFHIDKGILGRSDSYGHYASMKDPIWGNNYANVGTILGTHISMRDNTWSWCFEDFEQPKANFDFAFKNGTNGLLKNQKTLSAISSFIYIYKKTFWNMLACMHWQSKNKKQI